MNTSAANETQGPRPAILKSAGGLEETRESATNPSGDLGELEGFEVVIVGSGPAGSSTALHLAQEYPALVPRTLVLEAEHHPRHKLCGGGLTEITQRFIFELGLDLDIPFETVRKMVFRYRGQEFQVEQPNALFVVRREQFDEALVRSVQARGIEVREGVALEKLERVEGYSASDGGWLVLHTNAGRIKARAVVGADGAKSVVRRHMGIEEPSRVARAIEILTPEKGTAQEFVQGVAVFDFSYATDGLQGYVWDFPSKLQGEAYMNRGAGDFRVYPERPMAPMKEFFSQYLQRKGITLSEHKLMGNPSRWYDPGATISAPGILLVGDAAGIEPLGGDGISAAFWYGKEAARALAQAHVIGNWSFAEYSGQIAGSELGKYLTSRLKQARFIYGISRPLVFRVVWLVSGWRIRRAARKQARASLQRHRTKGDMR